MSLLDDVFELLRLATSLEEKDETRVEAATKYYEAVYLMKRYVQRLPSTNEHSDSRKLLLEKIIHYERHAATILSDSQTFASSQPRSPIDKICFFNEDSSVVPMPPPMAVAVSVSPRFDYSASITKKANRANAQLARALDFDESGQKTNAINAYMAAAEIYLEAIKEAEEKQDHTIAPVLKRRLEGAMDRLEDLKNPQKTIVKEKRQQEQKKQQDGRSLSEAEISVLRRSSLIASGLFLPWSEEEAIALSETVLKRPSSEFFIDPDGLLPLSSKQQSRLFKWARPYEIVKMRNDLRTPVMVKCITPYTIRQKYVTDCSFIASLCICAAFERRFKKRLVASILYPQTREGMLLYNPQGKYIVKLWLNGVARQVVVDDRLPVDRYGNLLCSHTTTKGGQFELWVSIIEKAYMKLCGGYDFPGSNSGVDLFSLTGWIPERIFFAQDPAKVRDYETPPERAWERLSSASSFGDCLITVSSSLDMSDEQSDAIGLVTGHAYAVLSVIQTKNGTRLLQLKNPWAHKGWKGRYSSRDFASWSDPKFCAEVGYNPKLAAQVDDGVFWICWEDVLKYFKNLHLSWNPSLFQYRVTTHGFWPKNQGPGDDTFNVSENPQYIMALSPQAIAKKASIWILLSRHVTKQEQEGVEANDFLTVHMHRNNDKRDRIWYPGGKNCVITGAYTNNAHVLSRYDVQDPADKNLSLVLSQYQKSQDLGYTLSCFCTHPFTLVRPVKDLAHVSELSSAWTEASAGGPVGHKTFERNPMFAVAVPTGGATIQLRCSAAKTFAINVMLVPVSHLGTRVKRLTSDPPVDSGNYRHGFVATDRNQVPAGPYTLIVSTYRAGQTGAFFLKVSSSEKLNVQPIA